ncbi:MAG: ABC transporter permease [Spirochaetia bacterium]|nr:ABC transporter permease [Spirochaetia bacterium]
MGRLIDKLQLLVTMASRDVIRRKRRALVVAATGAVAMICVVVSQGFINGMFESMVVVAIETGLGHAQIRPSGYLDSRQTGLRLPSPARLESLFAASLPAGTRYAPRMERDAMVRLGGETKGVILVGIEPEKEAGVSGIPGWIIEGTSLPASADPSKIPLCLVGKKLADDFEAATGDYVVVSTGGSGGTAVSFRCAIHGIFRSPAASLDERMVLMRRADFSRLRNEGDETEVSYFVFHGPDMTQAGKIKAALSAALRGEPGLETATYQEMEPSLAEFFQLYDQITILFYFFIMVGFGIVLFESVTMSIFERMHEIGMMHAIGTSPSLLFWQVMFETFFVTLAGVIGGQILGMIVVGVFHWVGLDLSGIQISNTAGAGIIRPFLKVQDFFVGMSVAAIVSFVSGIYPALRAVRVSPVRAIYNR